MAVETTEADAREAVRAADAASFEHESRADSAPTRSITLITRTGACWEVTFLSAARFCLGESQAPVRHTNECWQRRSNELATPRFCRSRWIEHREDFIYGTHGCSTLRRRRQSRTARTSRASACWLRSKLPAAAEACD